MNRTEKSIRMKLWFLDLIDEEDVISWINFRGKISPMKLRKNRRTKWTEEERQKLKSLFENLMVISRKFQKNFVEVRDPYE